MNGLNENNKDNLHGNFSSENYKISDITVGYSNSILQLLDKSIKKRFTLQDLIDKFIQTKNIELIDILKIKPSADELRDVYNLLGKQTVGLDSDIKKMLDERSEKFGDGFNIVIRPSSISLIDLIEGYKNLK